MIEIVPAILKKNFSEIKDDVEAVLGLVKKVQIDIIDGVFVTNKTWPFLAGQRQFFDELVSQKESLPFWDQIDYEFDLMISEPEQTIDDWISVGPSEIVIHFESVKNFDLLFTKIEASKGIVKWGLSFDDDLDVTLLSDYIEKFDYVQLMGIDQIGRQGQPPEPRVHYNLEYLKNHFPSKKLSVDGGVNMTTVKELLKSGASILVAGSAIYDCGLSPRTAITNFINLLQ